MDKKRDGMIRLDLADLKGELPVTVRQKLKNSVQRANLYPSGDYNDLKQRFASYVGCSQDQIVFSNGLDEMIDLCTRIWGSNNLIPAPTFSQYAQATRRCKQNPILTNMLNEGSYDLKLKNKELNSDLTWICSPNNPTGTVINQAAVEAILARTEGMVIVDECYYEYSGSTVVDLIADYDNLIVLRSFSKNFGLAGLRLGSAITQSKNINRIERMRQPFNVNRVAEKAGKIVLEELSYYQQLWGKIIKRGEWFASQLKELGFKPFPVNSNFILCDFESTEQAKRIYEGLKEESILTLPGWSREFSQLPSSFIRFTIGTKRDMEKVVAGLKRTLGETNC